MRTCFSNLDLDLFTTETLSKHASHNQLFIREKNNFEHKALQDILNVRKLKSLSSVKQNATLEEYLILVDNVYDRIAFSKFRLSNHSLMIEKGRHQNMALNDRSCPFCPNDIEDEIHLLVKCPTYRHLREGLFTEISNITIGFYYPNDENFLFWFLMKNPNFIRLSMELRTFLLENYRNKN